ncbi:HvfC family RiPP maturation protein [Acidithiobacillus thiooxidans]|uniref:HvfC family RiPP maturation protein n=1 Tax=Acidithiobacillus thiooxidans TaxID=930 RepID=UPI001C0751B4|nr:putative DNA-binding domain-containing protein [Acidithiobacillus thiooxidans]MBU2842489.1 DUF2063 domain-containing protein [Acidithiobacillus thiooxidans]
MRISDTPNEQDRLRILTAHLRNPAQQPRPVFMDAQAVDIYRELMVGNFDAALRACFPLWIRCLGEAQYVRWRDAFIAEHACRSPFFRQIPDEFMAYLSQTPERLQQDLPYALELAHLEWLELALGVAQADTLPEQTVSESQDPWISPLRLNAVHALVQYAYPVQQLILRPTFSAAPVLDPNPVSLYLYRDRDDAVQMLEPDALSLQILVSLDADPQSGSTIFQHWHNHGHIDGNAQTVAKQMQGLLRQMLDLQMIDFVNSNDCRTLHD